MAWTKLIGFTSQPDLATCEIATFGFRVLHVAARQPPWLAVAAQFARRAAFGRQARLCPFADQLPLVLGEGDHQ